ncbi:MAG: sigma 54-interacting transcriptional regulator, partial [Desulfovibrio sp.]|nr:sigma 54-interacting transcriptional regulator [Desulfovibrio sp.]
SHYVSSKGDERYLYIDANGELREISAHSTFNASSSPFQSLEADFKPDSVKISSPVEVTYPMLPGDNKWQDATFQVIRLSTAVFDEHGQPQGMLMLSIDLTTIRNQLSKASYFNAAQDKDQDAAFMRSFFFDFYGWILFQTEMASAEELKKLPLRYDDVRAGLRGDIGRRGYEDAFRPSANYASYYEMIEGIKQGQSNHLSLPRGDEGWTSNQTHAESVSFAPVTFKTSSDTTPEIIGGVAVMGSNFAQARAFRHLIEIFSFCFLAALILLTLCLFWISRSTSRRLRQIEGQLRERNENQSTEPLNLPKLPLELEALRSQVDTLLGRLKRAKTEHASQLAESKARRLYEPVDNLPKLEEVNQERLVGNSQVLVSLRQQIAKVALLNADVLVVGETGTGKELVSQAIHDASARASQPFISINCGALDENLLMDTLFGHVKGAFTEARQTRKGAFIAAEGGTLLLDEIGNAAPKVQQALLRALSTRNIRPLGSDQDLPFSARIIAATNADLRNDGKDGGFRNDLYFRLAVISIQTPPLRERKEDIPALVVHFMAAALDQNDKGMPEKLPALSRGALEKLMEYDWPGNVRELKNVVTRAMAFCQKDVLLAQDIQLDGVTDNHLKATLQSLMNDLNPRQQAILPTILKQGHITRQEYQELAPENISMRTAQYDLQQLVRLGLLRREGRGPSMSYLVIGPEKNQHQNKA